jgi:hypothetical protein
METIVDSNEPGLFWIQDEIPEESTGWIGRLDSLHGKLGKGMNQTSG